MASLWVFCCFWLYTTSLSLWVRKRKSIDEMFFLSTHSCFKMKIRSNKIVRQQCWNIVKFQELCCFQLLWFNEWMGKCISQVAYCVYVSIWKRVKRNSLTSSSIYGKDFKYDFLYVLQNGVNGYYVMSCHTVLIAIATTHVRILTQSIPRSSWLERGVSFFICCWRIWRIEG